MDEINQIEIEKRLLSLREHRDLDVAIEQMVQAPIMINCVLAA